MNDEVAQVIETKVRKAIAVDHYALLNESHNHAGPATNSHYNLTVVSGQFEGLSIVKRHQQLYRILADELAGPVHALALHLYSPQEWKEKGMVAPDSPDCRGG